LVQRRSPAAQGAIINMADSFDEEDDPQPGVFSNTNILRSSRARTPEAQRRLGIGISEPSRENDSEDRADATPRNPYRQTGGLRDRSRTELRSRNRGRATFGGSRFSRFRGPQVTQSRGPMYRDNGSQRGKVVRKGSQQLDRNTISNISDSDDSDIQRDLASRKFGEPRLRTQTSDASQRHVSNAGNGLAKPRLASSRSGDNLIVIDESEGSDGSGIRRVSKANSYRRKDYASPSTPTKNLSEPSILLLRFSSINSQTISKDKTQGEEARNSELLAAFGQKIKAHGFAAIPNELIIPEANASPPPETSAPGIGNPSRFAPAPPPLAHQFRDPGRTRPPPPAPPMKTYWFSGPPVPPPAPGYRGDGFRMHISGLPASITWNDLIDFIFQANLRILHSDLDVLRVGRGLAVFNTAEDAKTAAERLNGRSLKGTRVTCWAAY
jgi:hypothetical protein